MISNLVSVIVPVYNVEETLSRCINSIVNQTYKNIEIILVDDGSTDNSGYICEEYAKNDTRIKVVHKNNGGLGSARNEGVKNSIGDYIIFVDSDDWIELDTIEYSLQLVDVDDEGQVVVQYSMQETAIYPAEKKLLSEKILYLSGEKKLPYFMRNTTKTDSYFSACRCLFSRKLVENNLFVEGKVNEDIAWKFKIIRDCDLLVDSNVVK